MRILYLTYSPAPYRADLLDEMGRQCELDVIFEKSRKEVTNRDARWFKAGEGRYRSFYMKDCGFSGLLRFLCREMFDAAVVCGYSSPAEIISLAVLHLRGIPVLLCADGMLEKKEPIWMKMAKRFLISMADGYLAGGRYSEARLKEYGTGNKPVFLFPLTSLREEDLPVCYADREELRKKYGIREKTMILAAGQFIGRKGYDLLMGCLPHLDRESGVYVCGAQPLKEWEVPVQQYPNLHFPGFLDHSALLEMMRCCDIFVHPARYEIWGLAVSEAMMAGACTVTTDRCGAGLELVRNEENGMIVRAGDGEELLRVLKRLEKDVSFREALGMHAQAETLDRTVEKAAEEHIKALEAVICR